MKTALVTCAFTPDRIKLGTDLTFPRMRDYAVQYEMDFIIVTRYKRNALRGMIWDWERNDALYELFTQYDKILHLDDDVIVRRDARDIRDCATGIFYGCDNAPYNQIEVGRCWRQAQKTWPREFAHNPKPMQHLFNNGMFVADNSHRALFAECWPEPVVDNVPDAQTESHYKGMGLMNARLHQYDMPVMHCPDMMYFSYMWNPTSQAAPDFLHVLWSPTDKYTDVQKYIELMDAQSV